jgi:prepilin-type N-terminal cleavage/methylation domain-containing protein
VNTRFANCTRHTRTTRNGFTLIELLVVIALIAALAGMTMLIAPSAMDRDRAATAATEITGALQISRARAIRDGFPRGIRLVYNNSPQAVSFQYIESPPVFVPDPFATIQLTPPNPPSPLTPPDYNSAPWVEFIYTVSAGTITNRTCNIRKLTTDQANQIIASVNANGPFPTLALPTLGVAPQIVSLASVNGDGAMANGTTLQQLALNLGRYPDGALGGQTAWRTYHFGIYGPPRPLLGEPTYPLPQRSSVDLSLSSPVGGANDYDILFGPGGQLVDTNSTQGAAQIFLWLRDPTRGTPPPSPAFFQNGGEMIIVVIKAKSGAVGTAPVDQDPADNDFFLFAKKAVSGQ